MCPTHTAGEQRRLLRLSRVEEIVSIKRSWHYEEIEIGPGPLPWGWQSSDPYSASLAAPQNADVGE
jgi:predicted DNA-binding transcriptional regulator AlpA